MNTPTSNYLQVAGREIHWMEWGGQGCPVIIAWHGLARTCRDMDELAVHFAERGFRVICPDTIGRGLSQWSPVPDDEYQQAFYARLAAGDLQVVGSRCIHRFALARKRPTMPVGK